LIGGHLLEMDDKRAQMSGCNVFEVAHALFLEPADQMAEPLLVPYDRPFGAVLCPAVE
jgi:hypothetical protein